MNNVNYPSSPSSNSVIASLLDELSFPTLAKQAKFETNSQILEGYSEIVLREALKQNNTHVISAHNYFLR